MRRPADRALVLSARSKRWRLEPSTSQRIRRLKSRWGRRSHFCRTRRVAIQSRPRRWRRRTPDEAIVLHDRRAPRRTPALVRYGPSAETPVPAALVSRPFQGNGGLHAGKISSYLRRVKQYGVTLLQEAPALCREASIRGLRRHDFRTDRVARPSTRRCFRPQHTCFLYADLPVLADPS